MRLRSVEDVDVSGKKVIVRCGFDVPVDDAGNIKDDSRIRISVPTIDFILEKGAAQVIVMTHLGRPKEREANLRTDKCAERLAELIGKSVKKIDDFGEQGIPTPDEAKVVMLENLRFDSREKDEEDKNRDELGKHLADLADIYVNDSFSTCHRDHASMTSVPKFIKGYAGLSVMTEVMTITEAMEDPKRPFVSIIGGVKADKLTAISNLLERVDTILVGGALAFTLLKEFGYDVGRSKTDTEGLAEFRPLLEKIKDNPKVLLPVDAVMGNEFSADAESKVCAIEDIDPEWMALDIGPDTIAAYRDILKNANTIIWNGPIGVFEFDKFAEGTKKIAHALADADDDVTTIVGGGDSGAAIHKMGLDKDLTLVSSGGGASLKLFEGKRLIALEALKKDR